MLPFTALPYTLSLTLFSFNICRSFEIAPETEEIESVTVLCQQMVPQYPHLRTF
jgi:hypothetical protein